jgi:dUTP pyrophosphatase
MKVKFKKLHPDAIIPSYAHPGEDAGLDLICTSIEETTDYISYNTGLAVEIPRSYFGCLRPRSSNSKKDLLMCNAPGTVDSGYRSELAFRYKATKHYSGDTEFDEPYKTYEIGDKVGQLIILPYPMIEPIEAEELEESIRGENGYGSTGK